MLFISHDLAVVRMLADRVAVLFRGDVVETGTCAEVFAAPFHPYTHALLEAVPAPRKRRRPGAGRRADTSASPMGCAYAGRCAWQIGVICETGAPPWRTSGADLAIRCHHSLDELKRRATWPGDVEPVPQRRKER